MSPKLRQAYESLTTRFQALSLRERGLVSGLATVVIVIFWLMLFHDPIIASQQRLQAQLTTLEGKTKAVDLQFKTLQQVKRIDPNQETRARIARIQQRMLTLDVQLKQKMHGLIEPKQMAQILEQVLIQKTRLRLQRIQSLAAKPLLEAMAGEEPPASFSTEASQISTQASTQVSTAVNMGVYQHGLQIEFEGSYLETLDYLRKLAALDWTFFWDGVELKVEKYPTSRIIINIHTLSLQEGWIGV